MDFGDFVSEDERTFETSGAEEVLKWLNKSALKNLKIRKSYKNYKT